MKSLSSTAKQLMIAPLIGVLLLASSPHAGAEPIDMVSKEFTEDYLALAACGIILIKLVGVDSEKLDLTSEQRKEISKANFGWLDKSRLYEMQFELGDIYTDAFIDSQFAQFKAANAGISKISKQQFDSLPPEHVEYLAEQIALKTSVALGDAEFSNTEGFHELITSCGVTLRRLADKYQ